jgi:ABC-2 type transport system ATP-binding protein
MATCELSTAPAIRCSGLIKDYGRGRGVFDLDLTVQRGEVFGFIGPNGAGKTTTIRLLMDLIRPDRGSASVFEFDCQVDSLAVKRLVGYLPGEMPTFPGVTAGYVIGLIAGLRGSVDAGRVAALAETLDLDLSDRYEDLSHGNRQKVGLLQAFMHQPKLLILDEPTLGLDPLMQRRFHKLVEESVAAGATVFLSSHVLSEVEQICDRIALIRGGRLVRVGTLEELRGMRVHQISAVFKGALLAADLGALPGVGDVRIEDHHLTCSVRGPVSPLLQALVGAQVVEVDSRELSLEEVFISEYEMAVSGADS